MLHVSSLVVSPAFHHEHFIFLIHSSFCDTRTRSKIGTTRATPRRPSTSRTSKLPQSTCCAIKNHSGLKTCRVARTTTPTELAESSGEFPVEVGEARPPGGCEAQYCDSRDSCRSNSHEVCWFLVQSKWHEKYSSRKGCW